MYIAAIAFCIFEDSFEIKCIMFECFTFLNLKTLGREVKRYRNCRLKKELQNIKHVSHSDIRTVYMQLNLDVDVK